MTQPAAPAPGPTPDPEATAVQPWTHLPREYWPPERLRRYPWNPRKPLTETARQRLQRGMERYGLAGGLDVRLEDGGVIGGHQRLDAALALIAKHRDAPEKLRQLNLPDGRIPVNPIAGMPEPDAMAFNTLLNNQEAQSEFDFTKLQNVVSYLDGEGYDATLLGFDVPQLEAIATWTPDSDRGALDVPDADAAADAAVDPDAPSAGDDIQPPLPETPDSVPGTLYRLGRHRLYCGDSREAASYDALFGDSGHAHADGLWTDPPYGVSYVGKTADALTIENDALEGDALLAFLHDTLGHGIARTRPGGAVWVFAPHGPQFLQFATVLTEQRAWRQTVVWIKDRFVLGHSDYHYRQEPIFVGIAGADRIEAAADSEPVTTVDGEPFPARSDKDLQTLLYGWAPDAAHYFTGDRSLDTVWEIPRPRASRDHPTMKPVALARRALLHTSRRGAVWLDNHAGSGTLLLAAEEIGRTAYLIEKDPRYCDVIRRRYAEFTEARRAQLATAIAHDVADGEHADLEPGSEDIAPMFG